MSTSGFQIKGTDIGVMLAFTGTDDTSTFRSYFSSTAPRSLPQTTSNPSICSITNSSNATFNCYRVPTTFGSGTYTTPTVTTGDWSGLKGYSIRYSANNAAQANAPGAGAAPINVTSGTFPRWCNSVLIYSVGGGGGASTQGANTDITGSGVTVSSLGGGGGGASSFGGSAAATPGAGGGGQGGYNADLTVGTGTFGGPGGAGQRFLPNTDGAGGGGGGGGPIGAAGSAGTASPAPAGNRLGGPGGPGSTSSITGTSTYYGGGGGGGAATQLPTQLFSFSSGGLGGGGKGGCAGGLAPAFA